MDVQMNNVRRENITRPAERFTHIYDNTSGYHSVCRGKTVLQLLKYIILKKPSLFELFYVKVLNQKAQKGFVFGRCHHDFLFSGEA